MTTMFQRPRMRDRAAHLSLVGEADDRRIAREAAARTMAAQRDTCGWQDTQPLRDEARRLLAAGAAVDGVDIDRVHARQLTAEQLRAYSQTPARELQPAEAATEVGADDGDAARGFVIALPAALVAWAVIAAGAVTWKFWPQIAALFT